MARGVKTGGRAKGTPNRSGAEVRAYAGQYTAEAIEGLVKLGRTAQSEQARVSAWRELLDRAVGRPAQAVTGEDGGPLIPPRAVTFVIRQQPGSDNRT